MRFYGLQKMTLLDYPGKVACTIFTGGCNFRCPFCHNALLVTDIDRSSYYDEREVLDFLESRRGVLDGVCLTGGEPLIWNQTADFLARVKEKGFAVKLDTNGSFPDKLREAVNRGVVDYVAMDVKNSREKYAVTVGAKEFDIRPVEESVEFLKSGAVDYEFRTTVAEPLHDTEDIESIARWISGAKRYFLQNFKDSGNLIGEGMSAKTEDQLRLMLDAARRYVPDTELRGV